MTVGSNESGIKQRKFKLIQVPSLLFRPSELDSIILEEISNENEPTCFVDGLRSDIKGSFEYSYYSSYTVMVLQKLFFQVIGPGHCSKKLVIWLNKASEC